MFQDAVEQELLLLRRPFRPIRESGYRPDAYQAHFYQLKELRAQLRTYIRTQAELDECRLLINSIKEEVARHGIFQRPVGTSRFHVDLKDLAVSKQGQSAHKNGDALDFGTRTGLNAWKVPGSVAKRAATVAGLKQTYGRNDPPHYQVFGSLAPTPRRLRVTVGGGLFDLLLGLPNLDAARPGIAVQAAIGRLAPLVMDSAGRRIGFDPIGQTVVNDFGTMASMSGLGSDQVEFTLDGVGPEGVSVAGVGTATGPIAVEFSEITDDGEEILSSIVTTSVTTGLALLPVVGGLPPIVNDLTPPVVTPPPAVVVRPTGAAGAFVGALPQLAALIAGGGATDDRDPAPLLLSVTVNGTAIDDTSTLPVGDSVVTFAFDDASGNTGTATTRIRVQPEAPGAPGIPLFTAAAQGQRVVASWVRGIGASPKRFAIHAGTAPGASDVATVDMGLLTTAQGILPPGLYYLWIEAINGVAAVASSEVRLRVGAEAPSAPALGAIVNGQQVSASWTPVTGGLPEAYALHVGSQSGMNDVAVISVGTTTSVAGTLPVGTYYLRVAASTSGGVAMSNEVTVRTTCDAPGKPSGPSATVVAGRVSLTWSAAPGVQTYRLQVGTAASLRNIFDGDVGAGLSLNAAPPAGTYYVRLLATNACGLSTPSPDVMVVVP